MSYFKQKKATIAGLTRRLNTAMKASKSDKRFTALIDSYDGNYTINECTVNEKNEISQVSCLNDGLHFPEVIRTLFCMSIAVESTLPEGWKNG